MAIREATLLNADGCAPGGRHHAVPFITDPDCPPLLLHVFLKVSLRAYELASRLVLLLRRLLLWWLLQ